MDIVNSTIMATFFDIYEDGMNDIISLQKFKKEGEDIYHIRAFTNSSKSNDAYFAKIIVLTGEITQNISTFHPIKNFKVPKTSIHPN